MISEWLEEALLMAERRRKSVVGFRVVVEAAPGKVEQVKAELRRLGFKVIGSVSNFVVVDLKEPADLEKVDRIEGVEYVSYEKKFWPMAYGLDELFKKIAIAIDPLLNKLSTPDLEKLGFSFKPAAEIPSPVRALVDNVKVLANVAVNPSQIFKYVKWAFPLAPPVIARADWKLVTYTRELLGVPRDNRLSTRTYVGVIDTGVRYGPGLGSLAEIKSISLTYEPPIDTMSHGCLRNVKVYTTFCGLVDIEDLWNNLDTKPISVADGEYKPFAEPVFTIGLNGVSEAKGVFRVRSNKKVVIDTPMGVIEATPWHKFYVANPKKSKDGHRRWYCGCEMIEKRADELEPIGANLKGDWLVFKAYNGESWSLGLSPELAYLGGLVAGDGTIIYQNVNLKTGKVYNRRRGTINEVRIHDKNLEFLETLKAKYGGVIRKDPDNSYSLEIYSKDFVERIIPYLKPPINDLEALRAWVAGFFDAEGYVEFKENRPSDGVKICNTDKQLLELLRDVLNAVGVPCSIRSGGVSKGSVTYHLVPLVPQLFYKFVEPYCIRRKEELSKAIRSANPSASGRKVKYVDGHVLVPVKNVRIEDCDEYFYDLADTTEGNYSASGFIVHNSWCHACAFGKPAITRYGSFYPVANAPKSMHVKVFSAFGPCSGYQVMKAMELCAQAGCKVVSMSLGGTLTEPVDKDPECRLLDQLTEKYGTVFVVAAGNEDGHFEIGSPGAALKALTVAALDWKKVYHTSSYSSRGWQGKWYLKHKDVFEEHYSKWGDKFLKPDCGGIGGDRDSQIVSACSPWYDGLYDFVPDGWDLMIGTSMATPHIAGLVALAIDRGLLPQNVDKIKEVLRKTASDEYIFGGEIVDDKSHEQGWGVFKWERLRRG